MAECIKKNVLLDACINDNGDIFKEIRKMHKAAPTVSSVIDGVSNKIENYFACVYEKLYNSIDDHDELMVIMRHLNERINSASMIDVHKITAALVEEAICHLKNDKSDPQFQFDSECLKNAPQVLHEYLAKLFRSYLTHGHVSSILVVSTIIPLIKDKLGDVCSSNNYRSIALSSMILKVFDWITLLLYGDKLETDELQFGYKKKTSTNMCTWLAI